MERLPAVFLCSETYPTFKAAQQPDRRLEEAFGALERELAAVDFPVLSFDLVLAFSYLSVLGSVSWERSDT